MLKRLPAERYDVGWCVIDKHDNEEGINFSCVMAAKFCFSGFIFEM